MRRTPRSGPSRRRRRAARPLLLLAGTVVALPACGSAAGSTGSASGATVTAGVTAAAGPATVWLCRPGLAQNPCLADEAATVVPAQGPVRVTDPTPATEPAVDCFFVYPTVSTQKRDNANLKIQPAEVAVAVDEASRFSRVCRVWAPMYRQRTVSSLARGLGNDPAADTVAYRSVLSAWDDYLAHDNDGRPVVFIGHSQGAAMIIRLLQSQVDRNPARRRQLVSAIIAGGNVTVPTGRTVGATFANIPLCGSTTQFGCVIAYSSFPDQPPADSLFGIPGQGVSLQSGQTATTGVQVACVNPAAPGAATTAPLSPYFLSATSKPPGRTVTTPWVTYPDLYDAACRHAGNTTWLDITGAPAADPRPRVTESEGPTWGYHAVDVNLALGNLVTDVAAEEAAYARARR